MAVAIQTPLPCCYGSGNYPGLKSLWFMPPKLIVVCLRIRRTERCMHRFNSVVDNRSSGESESHWIGIWFSPVGSVAIQRQTRLYRSNSYWRKRMRYLILLISLISLSASGSNTFSHSGGLNRFVDETGFVDHKALWRGLFRDLIFSC